MSRSRLYPPSVDPGFPTLPELPDGWRRTTFGNILEVVERSVKLDPDRLYKLVTAKRSRGGIVLRSETPGREVLTKTQFQTKAGDFLVSRRQIIHGACGVVPIELDGAVVSNEYSTLRTRPGLSMDFLRHYSHTPYFQRTCFHSSHGVDVEKMIFKIDEWVAREIDVPPVPEQRKIAAILSSVDDAIEGTQVVIDQLQVVKKAMMAELLTRGLPGRHTRFKQTEIGEVPEEWEVVSVADIGPADRPTAQTGPFGAQLRPEDFTDEGVPVLRIGNVQWGRLQLDDLDHVRPEKAVELTRFRVKAGDLLFARQGATTGRNALADERCAGWLINYHIIRVSTDHERCIPEYLMTCFNSQLVQKQVGREKGRGNRDGINTANILAFQLPLPSVAEQQLITRALRDIDKTVEANEAQFGQLQRIKVALMSVLLTGELRVTPDEAT